jgi:hypothetical protein
MCVSMISLTCGCWVTLAFEQGSLYSNNFQSRSSNLYVFCIFYDNVIGLVGALGSEQGRPFHGITHGEAVRGNRSEPALFAATYLPDCIVQLTVDLVPYVSE